jgi:hypothetical protein
MLFSYYVTTNDGIFFLVCCIFAWLTLHLCCTCCASISDVVTVRSVVVV